MVKNAYRVAQAKGGWGLIISGNCPTPHAGGYAKAVRAVGKWADY